MPRPQGGSGDRSSSGHSYTSRSASGHRINPEPTRRPGSAQPRSGYTSSSSRQPGNYGARGPQLSGRGPGPVQGPARSRGSSFLPGFLLGSMLSRSRQSGGYVPPYDRNQMPYGQPPRRRRGSMLWIIILVVLFVLLIAGMFGCSSGDDSIGASTYNREKIQNPAPYDASDIVDEAGFFEDPAGTGQRLKTFYDKTGIQPYIVIEDYDPSLQTDAQKEAYAKAYYDEYISNEDTFLYMYFADADPDSVGYMQTVNGKNIESVMDSQAVDIFWDYLDSEWTTDKSTDDMFVDVFDKTADRIMTKTATASDVTIRWLTVAGIVIVAAAVILLVRMKHRRDKEKAEETRRILETPLKTDDPDDDDLVHRYGG